MVVLRRVWIDKTTKLPSRVLVFRQDYTPATIAPLRRSFALRRGTFRIAYRVRQTFSRTIDVNMLVRDKRIMHCVPRLFFVLFTHLVCTGFLLNSKPKFSAQVSAEFHGRCTVRKGLLQQLFIQWFHLC